MVRVKIGTTLLFIASLIALALSWIAAPIIWAMSLFGKKRIGLYTAPNPTAGKGFHPLEFRWVRAALNATNATVTTFFSLMATTASLLVMIRHLSLTKILHTFTEACDVELTRLATVEVPSIFPPLVVFRHDDHGPTSGHMVHDGNMRGSPDGNMPLGTRPKPDPIFFPAPA